MKRIILLLPAILCLALVGCKPSPAHVASVETELINVDSSLNVIQDSDYLAYLAPIHDELERQLSIPLGYAPEDMTGGKPESTLLNWASDALFEMAKRYYDGPVDFAVVNAGGLRCDWSAGDITFRNVFELMPFDNELVILKLSGENILYLARNCGEQGGQGVSADFRVARDKSAAEPSFVPTIRGKQVDSAAYYYVATSDYLSGGADGLTALTLFEERIMTGKKIRDLYIEYIQILTEEGKPIEAKLDGRMQVTL